MRTYGHLRLLSGSLLVALLGGPASAQDVRAAPRDQARPPASGSAAPRPREPWEPPFSPFGVADPAYERARHHVALHRWREQQRARGPAGRQRQAAAAPVADPRELGQPPDALPGDVRARLEQELQRRGLLRPGATSAAVASALVAVQHRAGLAPTGMLDRDTALLLGLDPERALPLEADAGALQDRGHQESAVGGEPGPATLPPDEVRLGVPQLLGGDAARHLAEAQRLSGAAQGLREHALGSSDRRVREHQLDQAGKADLAARLHRERFEELGGTAAVAQLPIDVRVGSGLEPLPPGEEVRAAYELELTPEQIERAQRVLVQQGFLYRSPNGRLDEPTRIAIELYEASRGREVTGFLDPGTAGELLHPGRQP